jgi:hypothetical protein
MFARSLAALKTRAVGLFGELRRSLAGATYRPEAHYMRGPGPKSRQKFAGAAR